MGTIAVDNSRNPIKVTATGGALAVPVTIFDNTFSVAPAFVMWNAGTSAVAGSAVIIQDVPSTGAANGRDIWKSEASGAYFNDSWRPRGKADAIIGLQVTKLDAGELLIFY